MTIDESAITRLLDESAIRDVTARFADAATRGHVERFRSTWAADGVWRIGEHVDAHGIDDIVAAYQQLFAGREFFVQFAVQGPIAVDGDVATASIICNEAARGPGEVYYRNHCVSDDELRRTDDGWVFTARTFQYLWLDTSPFGGDAFQLG